MFKDKFIRINKKFNQKDHLFKYLSRKLYQYNRIDNEEMFYNALLERETEVSTGIGNHIAIPHTKDNSVLKPTLFYVKLREDLDYRSIDNKPVRHIFLIAMPANYFNEHLKVLSLVSKLLLDDNNISILNNSNNQIEIYNLINKYLEDSNK